MKKSYHQKIFIGIFILIITVAKAQVSTPFNFGIAANYVGWNVGQLFPLTVAHKGNFPINFQTNGTHRMTIMNTTGFVGIGLGFTTPVSLLHLNAFGSATGNVFRTDAIQTTRNQWQLFNGAAAASTTEKGVLFTDNAALVATQAGVARYNHFNIQATQADLVFRAKGFTSMAVQERMRVTSRSFVNYLGTTLTETGVSISREPVTGITTPVVLPLAMLHIGSAGVYGGSGHRMWMNVGTYYHNTTDDMYVGLRQVGGTNHQAIISWGDDPTTTAGGDKMRFLFIAPPAAGPGALKAAGPEGLEIAQMWSDGNFGRTGFGNVAALGVPPQNTVHINGTATNASSIPGGISGLRIQDIKADSTPTVPNVSPGVLSVDNNGDVIFVDKSSGSVSNANNGLSVDPATPSVVQFGNNVGLTTAQLLNDRQVPFNNFNVFFTDPASPTTGNNRIQLGSFNPAIGQPSKFTSSNISADINRIGGTFSTVWTNFPAGFPLQANPYYFGLLSANYKFGAVALGVDTVDAGRAIGLSAFASSPNGDGSWGVSGKVRSNNSQINVGVLGAAFGTGIENYGGKFTSQDASGTNYGIRASITGTGYAGYFDGDVFINGAGTGSSGSFYISDQMFKTNVDSITNALSLLKQLKPKHYYFDTTNVYGIQFPDQKQYGLIAQDVETVLPELVSSMTKPVDYDSVGNVLHPAVTYKTLNYNAFIAILMKGIKEQQTQMDSLKNDNHKEDSINTSLQNQLNALSDMINSCCSSRQQLNGTSNTTGVNVDLKDSQSIVLEQNVPNPFAEQTTINYFLPDNVSKAQILFYNAQGKLIQTTDLAQRGKGQLNVFASDLSNGIYTYTLIVDGKIIETKKMVKQ